MISNKPLKRAPELQPLSHDHHHGLQLCWKIRTGFSKQIEPDRIKKYSDWFYKTHLKPHFELEEKYVFPILGAENDLVKIVDGTSSFETFIQANYQYRKVFSTH